MLLVGYVDVDLFCILCNHIQVILPRLKAMTWDMAGMDTESMDPVAVINLKVHELLVW